MTQLPQYADELDVLEHDIQLLRTLVDAAVETRDTTRAHALSEMIDDRKARLRHVMRDAMRDGAPHYRDAASRA